LSDHLPTPPIPSRLTIRFRRADSKEQKAEFAKNATALDRYCRDVEGELNKRFTLVSSVLVMAIGCKADSYLLNTSR
jgi:hypothetical protein